MYGEHSPCSDQAARSFGGLSPGAARLFPRDGQPRRPEVRAASPQVRRAFSLRWRAARAARGLCGLSPGVARLFLPLRAAQAARGLAHSPLVRCSFSLRGSSARPRLGLRKSSDRNRGLFAVWEGVASLGLSLPLSPPPCLLPPAGMG